MSSWKDDGFVRPGHEIEDAMLVDADEDAVAVRQWRAESISIDDPSRGDALTKRLLADSGGGGGGGSGGGGSSSDVGRNSGLRRSGPLAPAHRSHSAILEFKSASASGHLHTLSAAESTLMSSYESLDYEPVRNDVSTYKRLQRIHRPWLATIANIRSWATFAAIGCVTGLVAFVMDTLIGAMTKWKFDVVKPLVAAGYNRDGGKPSSFGEAYLTYVGISLGLGLVSTCLVNFGETVAAGSGIPEVKGYLNGTNYLRFLKFKTGVIKVVGILFSVSAGLIIGKEGPLIHIGSVVAANFATLAGCETTPCGAGRQWPFRFRTDHDKRDFVSGGAAAGVAAAFGSPTGGIVFALEEASSFWSLSLTWRTYLCTMLSTSTLWLLLSWRDAATSYRGLATFGRPDGNGAEQFSIFEVPFMVLPLATLGGFSGAAFCHVNLALSQWRIRHTIGRKGRRIAEVLLAVFLTSSVSILLPKLSTACYSTQDFSNWQCDGQATIRNYTSCVDYSFYSAFTCDPGDDSGGGGTAPGRDKFSACCDACSCPQNFNQLATLTFQSTEDTIKALFHNQARLEPAMLLLYTAIWWLLAVFTYGLAVPSGLFVPCILIGGGYGRMWGELMRDWFPHGLTGGEAVLGALTPRPTTYALIGAASMLSGVTRITITLTVILFETTDQLYLIMPIMATVLISKVIADHFNISLYDLHVELKAIPFVEPNANDAMEGMVASEVMSAPPRCLREVETVRNVLDLLRSCTHSGFPLVSNTRAEDSEGAHDAPFRGLVLRNHLVVLLRKAQYGGTLDELVGAERPPMAQLLKPFHFAADLESKQLPLNTIPSEVFQLPPDTAIDLRPYMNPSPISVHESTPIGSCFALFRGLGIRHLVVLNEVSRPMGIITRKELRTDFKQDLY